MCDRDPYRMWLSEVSQKLAEEEDAKIRALAKCDHPTMKYDIHSGKWYCPRCGKELE